MRIVELSDYSMVIMKDSQDPPWVTVGKVYRQARNNNRLIRVDTMVYSRQQEPVFQMASDAVCTAGRLVLFFSNPVDKGFHLHDKVEVSLGYLK